MKTIDVKQLFQEIGELRLKVIQLEYGHKNLSNENKYLKRRIEFLENKIEKESKIMDLRSRKITETLVCDLEDLAKYLACVPDDVEYLTIKMEKKIFEDSRGKYHMKIEYKKKF